MNTSIQSSFLSDRLNQFFLGLLVLTSAYLLYWGGDYVPQSHFLLFSLATLFGLFMAFNIGGNDVANSFGTSVGAGTLSIRQALVVAAVFEISGAVIAGGAVTDTIRKGIVDLGALTGSADFDVMDFVYLMMGALLAAALWLLAASRMGWPVSTTHSIVGGIVGASITLGVISLGADHAFALVKWEKIGAIVLSWILSPLLGGLFAYLVYWGLRRAILNMVDSAEETEQQKGIQAMESLAPIVAALGSCVITVMLMFKGLKALNLDLSIVNITMIVGMIAVVVWMGVWLLARDLRGRNAAETSFLLFSWMQVFTAAGFAFSHGANDIANAMGPFAAILDVLHSGNINPKAPIPPVAMFSFGIALVAGLWFVGKEVIYTVGKRITEIHPASGFAAELSAAGVVLLASTLGIPVSSTHILVGAVLGIGLLNKDASWGLMKPIAMAWVVTLPAAAILASIFLIALRSMF